MNSDTDFTEDDLRTFEEKVRLKFYILNQLCIISGSIHSGFNNFLSMCQCKLIGGWQHTIFSHHLPLGHKRGHVFTCAYVRMLDPHVFTHFSYAGAKLGKANGGHVRKRSWIQSNGHHHSIYACSHLSCVSSVAKTWKSRTVRWAR